MKYHVESVHIELLVFRQGEPFELELTFDSFLKKVVLELDFEQYLGFRLMS